MRVVLLARSTMVEFQRRTIEAIVAGGHDVCACLLDARPPASAGARLLGNLRKGRGGYVIVMALRSLRRRREPSFDVRSHLSAIGVPVTETPDPYSPETLRWLEEQGAEVIVRIGGFGIICPPLLGAAPHGILSFHFGDMRRYRGQPPALWEIYNAEREAGVTVQRLTEVLDAGEPIVERTLEIRPGETVGALTARMFEQAPAMMVEALDWVADPSFRSAPIEAAGRLYTLPNLRQWLLLYARIAARRLRRS